LKGYLYQSRGAEKEEAEISHFLYLVWCVRLARFHGTKECLPKTAGYVVLLLIAAEESLNPSSLAVDIG